MSWLFCCGDKNQQSKDLQGTVDLSQPQAPEQIRFIEKTDIEGLSGEKTKESQLLSNILTQQKNNQHNSKQQTQLFPQLTKQNTECDTEPTPFSKNFSSFNESQQNNLNSNTKQRTLSDKRLSNYLMQAQKIIQRKQVQSGVQDEFYNSQNKSIEDRQNSKEDENADNQERYCQYETDQKLRIKTTNNSKTRSSLMQQPFQDKRKSYINIGINYALTEEDSFCDLEQQINNNQQPFKNKNKVDDYSNAPFSATNKDSKSMAWGNQKPPVRKANVQSQRTSEVGKPTKPSQFANKHAGINKAMTTVNNNDQQIKQNQIVKRQQLKTDSSYVNKKTSSIVEKKTSKVTSLKDQSISEAIMNIEKSLNSSVESQQEQVYPSTQSAFNYQPKYFKPQTAKNGTNSIIIDQVNTSSNFANGKFFDSIASHKGPSRDEAANGKFDHIKNSQSIQTSSSTVLLNSINPSIIPKDTQQQQQTSQSAFYMSLSLKDKGFY